MKIKVDEKGILFVDDVEKKVSEIDAEFLEKIVEKSLGDEVNYEFEQDSSNPIVSLFESFQNLTSKDSDFRKELKKIDSEITEKQQELSMLDEQKLEDLGI